MNYLWSVVYISVTRQTFLRCGRWPLTLQGDFDKQLTAKLNSLGSTAER